MCGTQKFAKVTQLISDRILYVSVCCIGDFSSGAIGKESACQCRRCKDSGSILGSGRSLGVGGGKPFQYSYLENFMDKQAWQATVHGTTESQTPLSCVECTAVQTWKPWLLTVPSWKWGRIRLQVQREREALKISFGLDQGIRDKFDCGGPN